MRIVDFLKYIKYIKYIQLFLCLMDVAGNLCVVHFLFGIVSEKSVE